MKEGCESDLNMEKAPRLSEFSPNVGRSLVLSRVSFGDDAALLAQAFQFLIL